MTQLASQPALLVLEDGSAYRGFAFGDTTRQTHGEVVFNTSMTISTNRCLSVIRAFEGRMILPLDHSELIRKAQTDCDGIQLDYARLLSFISDKSGDRKTQHSKA